MSCIDVYVSNQRFCPKVIDCDWTDMKDTYVLDATEYGTRALARYLNVLGRNTFEWQTNPPYVEIAVERSIGKGRPGNVDTVIFRVGNFESKAIRLEP
jgi:hypothetical protein